MTNKIVTASTDVTLSYDENSKDFKEAFESFKKMIVRDGSIEDLMEHIIHNGLHFGFDSLIEGVGYIRPTSKKWKDVPEPRSGISLLSSDFPHFDYEHA